ncbi:MAG: hypothetical protein ACLTA5_06485 [Anaerococcus obesiensis]
MAVNSLTFLPAVVLPNKKDDEDILSPSLGLSLDLNIKFKMFILPPPKILIFCDIMLIYLLEGQTMNIYIDESGTINNQLKNEYFIITLIIPDNSNALKDPINVL